MTITNEENGRFALIGIIDRKRFGIHRNGVDRVCGSIMITIGNMSTPLLAVIVSIGDISMVI